MPIVLVDVVGEELFSGSSILSRPAPSLVLVLDDEDDEHWLEASDLDDLDDCVDCGNFAPPERHEHLEDLDSEDLCPETMRSGAFARIRGERPIQVAMAW